MRSMRAAPAGVQKFRYGLCLCGAFQATNTAGLNMLARLTQPWVLLQRPLLHALLRNLAGAVLHRPTWSVPVLAHPALTR